MWKSLGIIVLAVIGLLVVLVAVVFIAVRNVVIVRLGDGPDGDLYWPLVLQNIVDQLP